MSSSPPKQPPRSTNPRSGQNAFPQPLQVVRRSPTSAGNGDAAPAAGSQYANNFNRNADAKFSTGRRETTASSRYGGFDPADYGSIPSPPPLNTNSNPNLNRQRSRREQDEEEWEREQRQRKNSKNEDDFDEEVPRNDLPRPGASARRAAPQQERGRPGGPQRMRSGTAGSSSSYNNNSNSNANTNSSANNADDERDRQRERIHINIDGNGTSWTTWGSDGQQRSGNFSFSGTAFGGSPFGGGGGRNNSRLGPVNLPVNLPINIPGFGGFGF